MKTNFFGEGILQPGDDIYAHFSETFDTDSGQTLSASDLEDDSESDFGWTCSIRDEDLNEVQAHDFESRDALETWLGDQNVVIEG